MAGAPAGFEELKARIVSGRASLPKRLAQAAQHALANPDEIALGTAAGIAAAAGVQPSTLVRLAHHLGYDGFSDFQLVFRDRLKRRASTYEERLAKLEGGTSDQHWEAAILAGFLDAARRSIETISAGLDGEDFTRAVAIAAKAETIYIVARRRAYPIAAHLGYAFAKLGIRSVNVGSSNGIDDEIMEQATPRDVVIAASFAPYAPATIELARSAASRGVPVIAITDSALSPLAGIAAHWFEIAESDHAGFRSLSASMALAMALPVAVAEHRRLKA
jgi:DNA-binding MurR/RpiR family transcriptional regulator